MAFTNLYKAPVEPEILNDYGPDPYDLNFAFPLPLSSLRTDRVTLVPFVPRRHVELYAENTRDHPELWRYLPFDLSMPNFLGFLEKQFRSDPNSIVFAIIDTKKPDAGQAELGGALAGIIGLYKTSAQNRWTEIAPALIFPQFQRTHVSTHAIGILLRYCLELPEASGLGLRRVQWTANPHNAASIRASQRMGMQIEGTTRWAYVLNNSKNEGKKTRDGDPVKGLGRDSIILSVCWDDWENGVREHVDKLIARI